MKIISSPISKETILKKYNHFFERLIKAVIDIKKEIIVVDGELHVDLEEVLLGKGSKQEDIWGFNLYLKESRDRQIEYTALINIRPAVNNKGMEIENLQIRKKIKETVHKLIVG